MIVPKSLIKGKLIGVELETKPWSPELDYELCESTSDYEFEPPQDKISEDPFGIYNILNKQDNKEAGQDSDPSHPPGFTQEVNVGVSVNLLSSVGLSGGILCVWDPNSFVKDNATISDYFVAVRGTWLELLTEVILSQLAIRGVLIDGDWIDEPCKVDDLECDVTVDETRKRLDLRKPINRQSGRFLI
ncbi:hypothetical protein Tco_0909633 [Tanacetum coccineum]|uniref:Uncharacterized protein n=1 Tax=Tanacetum coccineum TaxID=301880 RepID=A0ABQ5CSQ9_9ASTR